MIDFSHIYAEAFSAGQLAEKEKVVDEPISPSRAFREIGSAIRSLKGVPNWTPLGFHSGSTDAFRQWKKEERAHERANGESLIDVLVTPETDRPQP